MDSMTVRVAQRVRSGSSRLCATDTLSTPRLSFTLCFSWLTEESQTMKKAYLALTIVLLILMLGGSYRAQSPDLAVDPAVARFLEREKALAMAMPNYSPLVETYIQTLEPDSTVTKAPKSDKYFLGK